MSNQIPLPPATVDTAAASERLRQFDPVAVSQWQKKVAIRFGTDFQFSLMLTAAAKNFDAGGMLALGYLLGITEPQCVSLENHKD